MKQASLGRTQHIVQMKEGGVGVEDEVEGVFTSVSGVSRTDDVAFMTFFCGKTVDGNSSRRFDKKIVSSVDIFRFRLESRFRLCGRFCCANFVAPASSQALSHASLSQLSSLALLSAA
jgi:hypothetical protein